MCGCKLNDRNGLNPSGAERGIVVFVNALKYGYCVVLRVGGIGKWQVHLS